MPRAGTGKGGRILRPQHVLLAGESWMTHSIHSKGFDSFTTTEYAEGADHLREALEGGGAKVDYLPNHLASAGFPTTLEALSAYDVVILSDIGANTLLLHPDTFARSIPKPDRLALIHEYVERGGGLVMIGGYLTFQGIEAKARYAGTRVEDALPVTMLPGDDRVEVPQGVEPVLADGSHPIGAGLPGAWPRLLGYNRIVPRTGASVVARVGTDPLLVAGVHGHGRSVAFASDCGPHWCPPSFIEWEGYPRLWRQIVAWASGTD